MPNITVRLLRMALGDFFGDFGKFWAARISGKPRKNVRTLAPLVNFLPSNEVCTLLNRLVTG